MEVGMEASGVHHHLHLHQQQQEMCSQTLESMLVSTKAHQEKKPRPQEQALKCPRCDSINTKFCYYNNYSLTQPRYFCKACRRYWTKGGTLRNVPVGGGCRKNKRSSSSITSSNSNLTALSKIREIHHQPSNLSLAFARVQSQANGHLGFGHFDNNTPHGDQLGFLGNTPNGYQNVMYSGGSFGNGDMGCVENGGILMGHDQDHEFMNTMLHDQENVVKQETCHERYELEEGRGTGGVLWGLPWQMGNQGMNMVHEVDYGRTQIGGWNGVGSTTWHGLINSPLM